MIWRGNGGSRVSSLDGGDPIRFHYEGRGFLRRLGAKGREGTGGRAAPLRRPEPLEPLGEVVLVGAEPLGSGVINPPAIHVLEPVLQHRAVNLREHVGADRDPVVGRDAEDVGVEGAVVDLAEGEAVRDLGAPALVAVGEYVGGMEQLRGAQRLGPPDAPRGAALKRSSQPRISRST